MSDLSVYMRKGQVSSCCFFGAFLPLSMCIVWSGCHKSGRIKGSIVSLGFACSENDCVKYSKFEMNVFRFNFAALSMHSLTGWCFGSVVLLLVCTGSYSTFAGVLEPGPSRPLVHRSVLSEIILG
jgi:hypothetical protein